MNASKWILSALALLFVLALIFSLAEQGYEKASWEDYYREVKAKGGTLDWNDYIPPPVPDAQNFFKAPKMQEWFAETLHPTTNDWTIARRDKKFGEITASLGTRLDPIKSADDARDYLAWSDLFNADFDLIREALKRPCARMDGNYSFPPEMPIPNFVNVRIVAQMLAQRAHCHLLLNQPDRALAELTLLNDSRRIMERAPTGKPMILVDAMINVAVAGLYAEAIADGLQSHAWQEPQLAALQEQLRHINLPPLLVDATYTENAQSCYLVQSNLIPRVKPVSVRAFFIRGFLLQNLVTITKMEQQAIDDINLTNNIVSASKLNDWQNQANAIEKHDRWPGNLLAAIAIPNFTKAWQTAALNQTLVNQTQIACALERYRLAHGQYPETLAALVPQFIKTIPHDIIGGQPLHYRRKSDGTFLLYSIGWNEKDDGGVPTPRAKWGSITNYMIGDWVWPN